LTIKFPNCVFDCSKERPYEDKRQDGYGYGYGGYDNGGYDVFNSPMGWGASHFDGKRNGYNNYDAGYDLYNSPMGWGDGHFDGYYKKRSADQDSWYPAYDFEQHGGNKRLTVKKRSSNSPLHQKTDEKTQAELAEIFDSKKQQGALATAAGSNEASTTGKPTAAAAAAASTTPKPQVGGSFWTSSLEGDQTASGKLRAKLLGITLF